MTVKLFISRAGTDILQRPGDVIDVSDREGRQLIEEHKAELVESSVETTVCAPPENAMKRTRGRPRKVRSA